MYYKHLKSVLTQYACNRILEDSDKFPFIKAPINFYGNSEIKDTIRNNDRTEFYHLLLSEMLEYKIKTEASYTFPSTVDKFTFAKVGEFFRLYRYTNGQFFKPHKDGHVLDGELESQITVLVYLNDVLEGGETVLMPKGYADKESHIIITPRAGDVLMFEHGMWHEGRPVTSGNKYVLRTDLFYSFDMFAK